MKNADSSGFTLIELLVVIAIIAILAAILFPVFTTAMEAGRRTQCVNQIKQVGIATLRYADDNNGFLPPYGMSGWNDMFTMKKAMKKYTSSDRLWLCPSDHGYKPTNVKPSFYAVYGSSYLFNGAIYLWAKPVNTVKLVGTCKNPRQLILYWDWVSHPIEGLWVQNTVFGDGHVKGLDNRTLAKGVNTDTANLY